VYILASIVLFICMDHIDIHPRIITALKRGEMILYCTRMANSADSLINQ